MITSFNHQYLIKLHELNTVGLTSEPRGMKIKELLFQSFKINPYDNIVTLPGFKTNIEYAREELMWYYDATNRIDWSDSIKRTWKQFSDDGLTVNSAYGHRIFGEHEHFPNQWEWVKRKLRDDPDSRQCIINLNYPGDKRKQTKDFVCTVYCQVFVRNGMLHWMTYLRSQDIYLGTRNDVYCFSEMQKRMAFELGFGIGDYYHHAGSLHIYERHFDKLINLLNGVDHV